MDRRVVLRLAGRAAVAGAMIDVLGPAIYPRLAEPWPHLIYVAIDLLLLLAMLGVWSARRIVGRTIVFLHNVTTLCVYVVF